MLWTDDVSYTYEEFSEVYRKEYKHKKQIDRLVREQQKIALQEEIIDYDAYKLKPNKMQEEFICSVHDLIERGAKKALLISATGTGKLMHLRLPCEMKSLRKLYLLCIVN